jgi:hypothetical protein
LKSLDDAQVRTEVVLRLERLRPQSPRLWGRMNASQVVCHLNDSFLGVMGEKPVQIPKGLSLWPFLKSFALYAPMKWPKGVPTRPELDQFQGGTPPAQFETDVRALIETIAQFTNRPRRFEFLPHPMFKRMSEAEWMRWGYLHMDHHLRQFGQ